MNSNENIFKHNELINNDNNIKLPFYISADKIFSSKISDLTNFAQIYSMQYEIDEYCMADGVKFADSVIQAHDVKIIMQNGIHSVLIQKYLANRTVIKELIIKSAQKNNNKLSIIDEIKFNNVKIQSFAFDAVNCLISFCFRYHTYSHAYTSYKTDGNKEGTTTMSVDAKWKAK